VVWDPRGTNPRKNGGAEKVHNIRRLVKMGNGRKPVDRISAENWFQSLR